MNTRLGGSSALVVRCYLQRFSPRARAPMSLLPRVGLQLTSLSKSVKAVSIRVRAAQLPDSREAADPSRASGMRRMASARQRERLSHRNCRRGQAEILRHIQENGGRRADEGPQDRNSRQPNRRRSGDEQQDSQSEYRGWTRRNAEYGCAGPAVPADRADETVDNGG